ncbi:unnamed protein product, partial [Didymodactylos carnosus]
MTEPKHSDDFDSSLTELPSSLPLPHSKYSTKTTTYGKIRIDLKNKSSERLLIEKLYERYNPTSEKNRQIEEQLWSFLDKDIIDNKNIDYFGLDNAHYRNLTFDKDLKIPQNEQGQRLDQQQLDENKVLSKESHKKKKSRHIKKPEQTENYIDQMAFPELMEKTKIKQQQQVRQSDATNKQLKNEKF